jgi:hypothetical protein
MRQANEYGDSREFAMGLEWLEPEFESDLEWESETAAACPVFSPTAVENPGGGRVKDKRAPGYQDVVQVASVYGGKVPLHRLAAAALNAMQCAASADGIKAPLLRPTSGFRDPKKQAELWAGALKKYGSPEEARKWVAPPGGSAHQSGRAIDFYIGGKNSSSNVANLRKLPAYHWLVANARRFGFYPYEREPWHWEYNPPAGTQPEIFGEFESGLATATRQPVTSAAPALLGEESDPPAKSFYVRIPLGAEAPAKPMTGIFCPRHFQAKPEVDLIIYLHGIKPRADLSTDRYWSRKHHPHFALREGLNESGKNAILVWPTLGPRSQNQTGWLTEPGGLDRFIEQVLAALVAYGLYRQSGKRPQVGTIILACHSGGGLPMRRLAMGKNRYSSKIKECWGFDCLYFDGDETVWPKWAKARPETKLFIYYQNSTRSRSEQLKRQHVSNISVSPSPARGHNFVPIHHWRERLSAAPLQSRSSAVSNEQEWGLSSVWDWFKPSTPTAPATTPTTKPNGTYAVPNPLALTVRTNAVALANQEWNRWNQGKTKESSTAMRPVLKDYWATGTGSERRESNWWSAVPWSAAFISWVMKKSGAGNDFKYSAGHSVYTAAAKENAIKNNKNLFKAYPITKVAPRLGDIVCKSRDGSGATYDNITPGMNTHCDIVTDIQPNSISVVGGNVSDSVSKKSVSTAADGKIAARDYFAVIRVGD